MAGNFLDLGGGGGDLKKFASIHLDRVVRFHATSKANPTIIVIDNDGQSNGMWSLIKKVTNSAKAIDGSEASYDLGHNLFVVPIPSGGKQDFYIERLFPRCVAFVLAEWKAFQGEADQGRKAQAERVRKNRFRRESYKSK